MVRSCWGEEAQRAFDEQIGIENIDFTDEVCQQFVNDIVFPLFRNKICKDWNEGGFPPWGCTASEPRSFIASLSLAFNWAQISFFTLIVIGKTIFSWAGWLGPSSKTKGEAENIEVEMRETKNIKTEP